MPAELGVGAILGNHRVVDLGWRHARPVCDAFAQGEEELRNRRSLVQHVVCKVIAAAEADDPALRLPLPILRFLESQRTDFFQKTAFVPRTEEFGLIPKPIGKRGQGAKKIRLCHCSDMGDCRVFARWRLCRGGSAAATGL